MKEKNEKEETKLCNLCGREIKVYEEYEYTKTRRGAEIYVHKECLERNRSLI